MVMVSPRGGGGSVFEDVGVRERLGSEDRTVVKRLRWMCMGVRPARMRHPPEGAVRKAPMIHCAARLCARRMGSRRDDWGLLGWYQTMDP